VSTTAPIGNARADVAAESLETVPDSGRVAKRPATILAVLLASRLLLRRTAAAAGIYSSVVLGLLGTVVAARTFSKETFGLFTLVVVATDFFRSLFDLTAEEALVKYGFRYSTRADWGRLRRLYQAGFAFKATGGALAGIGVLVFAAIEGPRHHGLTTPLLVAAALPLLYSLEGLAGAALFLRSRYDVRSGFLAVSMALRLAGIAVGARHGLLGAVLGVAAAQVLVTAGIAVVAVSGFRRFPREPTRPLGDDRREIGRFVLQSSAATGVLSLRGALAPLLFGLTTSATQLGLFKIAQAPQQGFNALSAPARMILLTEQTREWERGRQSAVLTGVRRYSALAALLMVAVLPPAIWFMPDLIRLVYSAKYVGASDAARLFAGAAALVFVVGWTKSFPVTIGRPQLRIWTHGLESVLVLPLVVALGAPYGATGAAAAVLIGTAAFALAWVWIFVRVRPEDAAVVPVEEAAVAEGEEIGVASL
jgi:O-antigen/teichoic acid export membrane protein